MEAANIPKPPQMKRPQVHHNLPHKFVKWFAAHGIEINQAQLMRWVEGSPYGRHQNWTPELNRRWKAFIDAEDLSGSGYTQQQIFNKMDELANDPLFQ